MSPLSLHTYHPSITPLPRSLVHLLDFEGFGRVFSLDQVALRLIHQANLVALRLEFGFLLVALRAQYLCHKMHR